MLSPRILWFVLAGFILGFIASSMWEWYYFRGKRLVSGNRRLHDLQNDLIEKEEQIAQLKLNAGTDYAKSDSLATVPGDWGRAGEIGPAAMPVATSPALQHAAESDEQDSISFSPGSSFTTVQPTVGVSRRASANMGATVRESHFVAEHADTGTDTKATDIDAGATEELISFRRGPARRASSTSRLSPPTRPNAAEADPPGQTLADTPAPSRLASTPSITENRPFRQPAADDSSGQSAEFRARSPHPQLDTGTLKRRPLRDADAYAELDAEPDAGPAPDSDHQPMAAASKRQESPTVDQDSLVERPEREFQARQPVGNQPVGNQPVGNQPVGNQPVGNQPVGNQPVEFQSRAAESEATVISPEVTESGIANTGVTNTGVTERTEVHQVETVVPPTTADAAATVVSTPASMPQPSGGTLPEGASIDYPDDLAKIKGIGRVFRKRLYEEGVCTWHQLAQTDNARLGQITRARTVDKIDSWKRQARDLAKANDRVGAVYDGPTPDNLDDIDGITPTAMQMLFELGIVSFRDLGKRRPADLRAVFEDVPGVASEDILTWVHDAQAIDYKTNV